MKAQPSTIEFHVAEYRRLARKYNANRGTPAAPAIHRQYQFHFWTADLLHCEQHGLIQGIKVAKQKLAQLKRAESLALGGV